MGLVPGFDPEPLAVTLRTAKPEDGVTLSEATGGRICGVRTVSRAVAVPVAPTESATVRVTTN